MPFGDVGSSHLHVETAARLRSGMRTDAAAAVPGAPGLPGGDADLLHHPGAAGDPRQGGGPPSPDEAGLRHHPADPQRRRAGRAALAGRVRRPGLDAAAAPHLARGDAAGPRARAAGLQHQHDRPGAGPVRQPGAEGPLPGQDGQPRHLVVPGLLRARRRLRPGLAAHHRRPGRRRVGRQRSEDLDDHGPARRLDLLPRAARTRRRRRSSAASRCWSSRWTPPA